MAGTESKAQSAAQAMTCFFISLQGSLVTGTFPQTITDPAPAPFIDPAQKRRSPTKSETWFCARSRNHLAGREQSVV
jgi:hypothetical protein